MPALRRTHAVTLAAVADVDAARRVRVAAGRIPSFPSLAELLAGADVDAVVIATPPSEHLADAEAAAEAGRPTLVEKPPAADVGDARRLAALSPPPWIGFNRRFLLGLGEARTAIAREATSMRLEFRYRRDAWQPYTPAPDALLDAGVHLVDLARWLTASDIRRVRAAVLTSSRAVLDLELGRVRGHIECAVDDDHREVVEAVDAKGAIVHRYADGGPLRALMRRARHPREDNPFVNSLVRQLEAFAGAVRGEPGDGLATAADGLAVMQGLDAARRSADGNGSWHELQA